jgi:hypothetical protein
MIEVPRRHTLLVCCLLPVMLAVLLLPWWRNHGHLRDLYDYGLVLAANGHLDRGERPYVDFTTPIQAGFLGLNWAFERQGGGTYAALTRGAAALIVLAGLGLTLMLARRLPWWAALVLGGAVTVGSAAQHTILWHNALGVCCLAVVCWATACAPILRRSTWPWHVLAGVGLLLGGINKVNFQLVAIAAAFGWAFREGLVRRASWMGVGTSVLAILLAGVVLPVGAELAWTGAALHLWFVNVVRLAASSRWETLAEIFSVKFLFHTPHDYYGPLLMPQVGLFGCFLSLTTLAGCWPNAGKQARDRWLLPVAVAGITAAGAALLATNYEIASLGLAAWLALAVSLWLGFRKEARGIWFGLGVLLPALLLGTTAWWSAWQGQRSQFGYSHAPRGDYRSATEVDPALASLAGLRLPPDVVASLSDIAWTLPAPRGDGRRPVFFGLGLEWAGRYWPAVGQQGRPLWIHWGTTYDAAAIARLKEELLDQHGPYQVVLTTVARDDWPPELRSVLEKAYVAETVGPVIKRWTRRGPSTFNRADSFETLARLGGNVEGRYLFFDRQPLVFQQGSDGRVLLGTSQLHGNFLLRARTYRLRAVAVLERLTDDLQRPITADMKVIIHGGIPEDVRWSAHVEIPAGQRAATVPVSVDAAGQMTEWWFTQPNGQAGLAFGGYREI